MSEPLATARPISLDEFAAMSAAIEAGVPSDQVLGEARLSAEAWEAEKERCLAELAGQAAVGRLAPSRRCAEIVVAERPRASAKAKKSRKKVAGAMPVAPVAVISNIVDIRDTPAVAAMQERDRGAAPVPPPPPPPASPPTTAEMPPVVVPPRRAARPTVAMPIFVPDTQALPFQPTGDAAPARDKPREPDSALPFVQPGRPSKKQRATVAMPVFTPEEDTVDGEGSSTAPMQPSPLRAALPFAPSSKPEAPQRAAAPRRDDGALPFHKASAPAAPAAPQQPAVAPAAPAAPSPPSPAEAMERARAMTLHDYANLCAGVRALPEHVAWIQSLFGLDAAAWSALHAVWRSRFDQDRRLKAEWGQLVSQGLPYWMQRRPG